MCSVESTNRFLTRSPIKDGITNISVANVIDEHSTVLCHVSRGVARNLFRRGTKQADWGVVTEVLQRGPGAGRALVGSPRKLKTLYANNHCNNVLTKNPYFQHGNFRGDMSPLFCPPFSTPLHVSVTTSTATKSIK